MQRNFAIRRLLAVLIAAALVLAPLSRPVMAALAYDATMATADQTVDEMSAMDMDMDAAMADEMPCCPSKAPAPIDCDKCVFMAGCMSKCVTSLVASFELFPVISATLAPRRDGARLVGLGQPPPEHPPRVLV